MGCPRPGSGCSSSVSIVNLRGRSGSPIQPTSQFFRPDMRARARLPGSSFHRRDWSSTMNMVTTGLTIPGQMQVCPGQRLQWMHWQTCLPSVRWSFRRGAKDPAEPVGYTSTSPSTKWSCLMRRWPGFATTDQTSGHVIRYLPRDYKIFRAMEEGWQYPAVWGFVEDKRQLLLEGLLRQKPSAARKAMEEEIIKAWTLPYDPKKFPNKWWKLVHDKPVRT